MAAARETLRRVFGHPDFRGLQADVIGEILAGRDALAILPTGGGKSLCYQIPALVRPGLGLVVSPLIALMQDQVAALTEAGVFAARLDSSLGPEARAEVWRAAGEGRLDILYVSPEGLASGVMLERLSRLPLSVIAIDEAHCVSQWGHDFRPDYRGLGRLAEAFPNTPRLAVTATADPATQADIARQLRLEHARAFVASFDRPNLALSAERKNGNVSRRIVELARARRGKAGVVYTGSRDGAESLALALKEAGVPALAYHAGIEQSVRAERQAKFQAEDDLVMVATIAFGMGVDKPDVRFVLHADPPRSIEAYWQEVGRAGRDGAPAEAMTLYGAGDLRRALKRIEDGEADAAVRAAQAKKARQLFGFLDATSCRRAGVRRYFGEVDPEPCGACDVCTDPPDAIDATELAQKALSAMIRMDQRVGRGRLIDHLLGKPAKDGLDAAYTDRSTYGCGAGIDEARWRAVFDQLMFDGVIGEDGEEHRPTLAIADGEAMRAIFKSARRVEIRAPKAKAKAPRKGAPVAGEADDALLAALKAWRRETAARHKVPPYVVFHDATLAAIAAARPATLMELSRVSGVGEKKIERYGAAILERVREKAG
jgi:ATP-dependent DNA helicase RecQ